MKNAKSSKKSLTSIADGILKQNIEDQYDENISPDLIVVDVDSRFYGKGLAFIPTRLASQLEISDEDCLEIHGNRTTYITCQIMPQTEEFIDSTSNCPPIQIDSNTRKNAGVVLGDKVRIKKIIPSVAERVYLAVEEDIGETERVRPNLERLRRYLKNSVVHKTDEIWIPTKEINSVISPMDEFEQSEKLIFHPDLYYTIFHVAPVGAQYPCLRITDKTEIIIRSNPILDIKSIFNEPIYLNDVGGLSSEKQLLKELIGLKVYQSETLNKSRLRFANAILLTGQTGTGKTLISKAIVNEFPVCAFMINGPELIGDKPQTAPQELNKIVDDAIRCAPSIIVIDEIEAIATTREDLKFDAISRNIVIATLLILDKIAQTSDVVLIGTTNKPELLDASFRTTHRFSKEIKFFPPKVNDREEILNTIICKSPVLNEDLIDVHKVAEEANGFTGADLNLLIQEAFIDHLKEVGLYPQFIAMPLHYQEIKDQLAINTQNFLTVLKAKTVKPSIMRSYIVETPKITFNDVGGLSEAKHILEECIKFPLIYPDLYQKFGTKRTKGCLLFGPPGCGKTLLAKALACESNMNFIYIKAAEVLNRWLGESEAAIREVFAKAKAAAPCIVFFDELDAVSTTRGIEGNVHSDRVTAQILTEIDGLEELKNIICIGATNRLDIIDPAIMRPGRLYPIIKIDFPNEKEREEIFGIHLRNKPLEDDVNVHELAVLTQGMGGASIEEISHQAGILAIREDIEVITGNENSPNPSKIERRHFLKAIDEIKKKTPAALNQRDNSNNKFYV